MERWCGARGVERGAVVPVEQCWELARLWYRGRLDPDWTRRTREEMQAAFEEVGLVGEFWGLGGG